MTSGMTVIRMALIHSVPSTASESAARKSAALPEKAINMPATSPTARASSTRLLSFVNSCLFLRSLAAAGENDRSVLQVNENYASLVPGFCAGISAMRVVLGRR